MHSVNRTKPAQLLLLFEPGISLSSENIYIIMSLKMIIVLQHSDHCFSLLPSPDFQQQVHDHHPDAADRVCSPQNACLIAAAKTTAKNNFFNFKNFGTPKVSFFFWKLLFWVGTGEWHSRSSPPSYFLASVLGENLWP